MILFLNTFLPNEDSSPMQMRNSRYLLPAYTRYEVLKYTLASYAALPYWTHVFLYIGLDTRYQEQREELEALARSLFPRLKIYWHRCAYQREWQRALEEIFAVPGTDLVWHQGNHDHPFIDSSLEALDRLMGALQAEPNPLKGAVTTHFPEFMHYGVLPYWQERLRDEGIVAYDCVRTEPVYIVSKPVLHAWFWGQHFGDTFVPRTDWLRSPVTPIKFRCYGVLRELCRHFDGYDFYPNPNGFVPQDCPPLDIPEGFWMREVRVQFGGVMRQPGWTWFQPCHQHYRALHTMGVDWKWMEDEVPLFWQGRMKERVNNALQSTEDLIYARNRAYLQMALARFQREPKVRAECPPEVRRWLERAA